LATAWVVYACRTAYAAEVLEIIGRRGDSVDFMVDNIGGSDAIRPAGLKVLGVDDLPPDLERRATVVPLLTPGFRYEVVNEARDVGFASFPSLVDPTAVVAATTEVGEGVVVNAGAVIGAYSVLGSFAHVNRSASLGHDNAVDSFASVGPGCVFAGNVTVGRGAFVGAGVVCAPAVSIGANAIVGAGAVVVRDVEPGTTVVGNPARAIASEVRGYRGVVVPER
jgi:sugar O-acyltransferase (sialic acid O-acetyltransferase NeuD family)